MNKKLKMKGLSLVLAVIAVFSLLAPAAVLASVDEWTQFHKDEANGGYSSATAPDTGSLKWVSEDIDANSGSSVAVAEGKVFVYTFDSVSENASITVLNQADGSTGWTHAINASPVWGNWSTPAYHDGKVFMATDGIYCLDATDGHEVWSYPFPSGKDACNGSVTVADGKVIAGDWDGATYYCVDESNGAYIWDYDCGGGYAQGTPAYYDDGGDGKVYLTSWGYVAGNVWCLNAATGDMIWHGETTLDTCGSPMVADGKVWVTTYNFSDYGELMAFDIDDIGDDTVGDLVWGPLTIERTDSTPTYHDGKIYVCGGCYGYSNEGERTYCIDVATASIDWQTPVNTEPGALDVGNWTCSVAVADGKVFVGKPDPVDYFDYSAIYALNAADGSEVWHYDHGGASPAVAGGVVYTIGEGRVWAFEDSPYKDWDVNKDSWTNAADIGVIGLKWMQSGFPGWIREDVNNDGYVNAADIGIIGLHWMEYNPPQ